MKDEQVKWRVQTRLSAKDGWVNRGLYRTEDGAKFNRLLMIGGRWDKISYGRKNVRVVRHEVKPA